MNVWFNVLRLCHKKEGGEAELVRGTLSELSTNLIQLARLFLFVDLSLQKQIEVVVELLAFPMPCIFFMAANETP